MKDQYNGLKRTIIAEYRDSEGVHSIDFQLVHPAAFFNDMLAKGYVVELVSDKEIMKCARELITGEILDVYEVKNNMSAAEFRELADNGDVCAMVEYSRMIYGGQEFMKRCSAAYNLLNKADKKRSGTT